MAVRLVCRDQGTWHRGMKACDDGVFEFNGEIVLFISQFIDPVELQGDVLHVFAGAKRLEELGGALVDHLDDSERIMNTLARR